MTALRTILEAIPLAVALYFTFKWPASAAETISVQSAQHAMWSATGLALIAVWIIARHFGRARP